MKTNCKISIFGLKVILVPYRKHHVIKYHNWMSSEELLELTASESLTLEEEYKMQESWLNDNDKCTFIVLDKETFSQTNDEVESMIGDVNLFLNNEDDSKSAEIEVMIADVTHRAQGKGKEALLLMMRYGIEVLHLHKFIAKIKLKNEGSIQLFKKIGFKEINKSDYFQEVEMACDVNESLEHLLSSELKCYKINEH